MMDCSQFREMLADLDRQEVLTAELREQALAHAEGCGECGQLLTETESLDSELRRLADREGDSLAPARMEGHLLRAFREQKAAAARENKWRYAAVIGVAATVLLAVGFWMYRSLSGDWRLPSMPVKAPLVAVRPSSDANCGHRTPASTRPPAHAVVAPGTATASANGNAASSEGQLAAADDAAFIPLPDADPGTLDDGAVVRVMMPRAALASFGLPVEAMEGDGTVRADLIVSADGTPQAIRLVSQDEGNPAAER
jgi:hypothetical protein